MLATVQQDLQHATPESQGIASSVLLQLVEALESQIHELHSFMLLRHGRRVAAGWWSPYGPDDPHMLFSLSKSFTSTAVGLAVAEGRLSVDDPVISFFPDETPAKVSPHLAAMRVRHLLSMSTGHDADTMGPMTGRADGNWIKGFLGIPVDHEPGTHFVYNTGATYMQSAIVQKVTGMKLIDYLTPRLFEPLGIKNATWEESPQGINTGGFGLSIKTRDIARFGQLYLQKGMWQGKQIIPEAWIAEATTAQISNGDNPESDWTQGYGYQFWRCRHNAYRGDGAFGQYCIVMPEQDAVLAITAGVADMQPPLNLVWDMLLPGMQAQALPEDAAAQDALSQKLSSLSIPAVEGQKTTPIAANIAGQIYQADANEMNVQTVTLKFDDSGAALTLKTTTGEHVIPCGYGHWQPGHTALYNRPWETEPAAITSSGAWTADNSYRIVVRFYETPFYEKVELKFDGTQVTVEIIANVGFEPPKTRLIVAHAG